MSQHTPEPWHTGGNGTIIYDKDGWGVASVTTYHGSSNTEESKANAARIVRCVNALALLPDECLDGGWTAVGISEYAQGLDEQRDELLAALKSLEKRAGHMAHQCGYFQDEVPELATARTAIAKCESAK